MAAAQETVGGERKENNLLASIGQRRGRVIGTGGPAWRSHRRGAAMFQAQPHFPEKSGAGQPLMQANSHKGANAGHVLLLNHCSEGRSSCDVSSGNGPGSAEPISSLRSAGAVCVG